MKNLSVKKLALAGMFCALAVVGSVFSFPIFGSKCAPVQHMVNILCAVLLGPYYGVGAAGVQLATRFITTYECDASQGYKDVLLNARPEDVRIIHSPVGMPGRALNTPLVQALAEGTRFPPRHCARCLKTCDPAKVPYCITHALIEAVKGNVEEGLFFCGANVGRLDRMRTVQELMDELVTEWRQNQ